MVPAILPQGLLAPSAAKWLAMAGVKKVAITAVATTSLVLPLVLVASWAAYKATKFHFVDEPNRERLENDYRVKNKELRDKVHSLEVAARPV
jgi:hypothetical protein